MYVRISILGGSQGMRPNSYTKAQSYDHTVPDLSHFTENDGLPTDQSIFTDPPPTSTQQSNQSSYTDGINPDIPTRDVTMTEASIPPSSTVEEETSHRGGFRLGSGRKANILAPGPKLKSTTLGKQKQSSYLSQVPLPAYFRPRVSHRPVPQNSRPSFWADHASSSNSAPPLSENINSCM
ncbi:hypothetical protein R3P38DRAFT_2773074 [Favolaschia claudopus]|uniref:Uncharacterized protein n=1 Tax=Favolaschia claudopus TaxID=2862362 RepID=A0AAW0C4G1_9AGAR